MSKTVFVVTLGVIALMVACGTPQSKKASNEPTGIFLAAFNGDVKGVEEYLAKGKNVNDVDGNGSTALMYATNGHLAVVKLLIEKGADVNIANKGGSTALISAAALGKDLKAQEEIVGLILSKKADANAMAKNGSTAILNASQRCRTNIGIMLLNAGANPNVKDRQTITPLLWAVNCNNVPLAQALIAKKADVNARTYDGKTPRMLANSFKNAKMAALLKRAGAK